MLIIFFDGQGTIHHECVQRGLGIGSEVYLGILERFQEHLRCRRPEYWSGQAAWALLHDGAPAHRADPVQQWLESKDIEQVPHPGYSPDLSPADFWLFQRIKSSLQGIRFESADDLQTAVNNVIDMIDQDEYHTAMDCYLPRLRKCIESHGDYFERK